MARWNLFVGFPVEIEETRQVFDYHGDILTDLEVLIGKPATEQVVDSQEGHTWTFETEAQGKPAYEKVLSYLKEKEFGVDTGGDQDAPENDEPRFVFDVSFEQDE